MESYLLVRFVILNKIMHIKHLVSFWLMSLGKGSSCYFYHYDFYGSYIQCDNCTAITEKPKRHLVNSRILKHVFIKRLRKKCSLYVTLEVFER